MPPSRYRPSLAPELKRAKAEQQLAALMAEPLSELVAQLLAHYGRDVPVEEARRLASQLGLPLPAVRRRQQRLAELLTQAGRPPRPVLATGERCRLRLKPQVEVVVASLTRNRAQVHTLDDPPIWLAVPLGDLLRVPATPPPDDGLSPGQRALRALRRRRELLEQAKAAPPPSTTT